MLVIHIKIGWIMPKKDAQIANCNIVFGDEERPMLDFFDTIVYPAITSNVEKTMGETSFLFKKIELIEDTRGRIILLGLIVKKTVLEIKSDLNADGELIEKDERHSSAPYSLFAINLVNHRMIFLPNQKGSPSIANFQSLLKYVIDNYRNAKNAKLDDDSKLPYALVKVVGIPSVRSIDQLLENIERINSLTLRFYPLNGDLDYSEAFGIFAQEMRSEVGSKNGEIVFRSPKFIDGVKNVLEKAAGTINPILRVVTKSGSKAKYQNEEFAERIQIEVEEKTDIGNDNRQILGLFDGLGQFTYTNENHNAIYERNKGRIISLIEKGGD